jgi:pSer/pThr/pTyr-binding forkhead associated (FHA) protein
MPTLLMMTATGESRQVQLNPLDNKVGRGATNDVIIDSAQASRDHAVIAVEQAFVTITDIGSRNGTFVNDIQIESQVLAHGDAIRLGTYEMRFIATDQEFTQVEALRMLTMQGLLVNIGHAKADAEAPTAPGVPLNRHSKP